MSYLQNVNTIPQDVRMIREFRGYNHNSVIGDGEFYEQKNISSDEYPLMSAREARSKVRENVYAVRAVGADHMAWISEDGLYYNGTRVVAKQMVPMGMGQKWTPQLIRMGAYLCVFPHGIVYNTHDGTVKNIATELTTSGENSVYTQFVRPVTNANGERTWEGIYGQWTVDPQAPTDPKDGEYWINPEAKPYVIRRWSSTKQLWESISTVYIAIVFQNSTTKVGSVFNEGDGITLSGFEKEVLTDGSIDQWDGLNGSYVIEGFWDQNTSHTSKETKGGIVIAAPFVFLGMFFGVINGNITIRRMLPSMDYVCEMGNRLYGCSTNNHEIYASKLGDPLNWNVFQGVSTDSYAATVGTPGKFTGCIGYRDSVLFFKEDCIHILSGTRPATFQIDTLESNGVKDGSFDSLCIVNETLFYKGVDGFYAYSGGLPQFISDNLGKKNKERALCAGTDSTKYFTCIKDGDGYSVLVYDVRRGLWTREDDMLVECFASLGTVLYAFDELGNAWCLNAEFGDTDYYDEDNRPVSAWETPMPEGEVEFSATTCLIGLDSPFAKYISNIRLRMQVDRGTVVRVLIDYDESGRFQEVERINGQDLKSVVININPKRCDTMRIRFEGKTTNAKDGHSGFKLYSMSYVTEQGGEV